MNTPCPRRLAYFENWVDPVALDILARHPAIDVVRLRYSDPVSASLDALASAAGYQIHPRGELQAPWFGHEALLRQCPRLLAICSTGSGFDMVDVEACTRAGVIVCNQAGSNRNAVAEHAVGLMLALLHRLLESDRALRESDSVDRFACAGTDMHGKTVGLIGIGQIGSRVASICHALGMRVLAYDPHLGDAQVRQRGAEPMGLHDLLASSDIVSVHCPRSAETLNMIDAGCFSRMKKGAYFVSTARGGIHVEEDLHIALTTGHLAGAGLDVFLQEPPPRDHPLLALRNVIATPHSAGLSREAVQAMASFAANQWVDILEGRVPPRLVNPQAWPRYSARFERAFGFAPAAL